MSRVCVRVCGLIRECVCTFACVPRHKSRCFRLQCLQALLDLHESLHGAWVGHYREGLRVLHLSSYTMDPSTANHNPILYLPTNKDPLQHILKKALQPVIHPCTSCIVSISVDVAAVVDSTCCRKTGIWDLNCSCSCGFPANKGLFINTCKLSGVRIYIFFMWY